MGGFTHRLFRVCGGAGALGLLCLAGCVHGVDIPQPKYVKSHDQAGTLLVSATMVAPWDEVAPSLNPAFSMNGTTAAALVLPTTEQVSQQVLNATSLAAGIGLPQTSSTSSSSLQSQVGGSSQTNNTAGTSAATSSTAAPTAGTTTTTTVTTTGASSQQANFSQSNSSAPGQNVPAPTTNLPTSLPPAPTAASLGTDPVLRYKAAAYLNQEVQLLNNEVAETARRRCYVPYVVKLKLAFMPYVNPLPYSVHTQISFLQGKNDRPPSYPDKAGLRGADRGCSDAGSVPFVVPFLAADDLQIASYSNTMEEARQIALAASFMAHGITGNLNGNHLYEALTAIQNEEMHSALTVARTVNNGLYVLIAPNNEATGRPGLVGQTYDVAVLLLVPRGYFGDAASPPTPSQISILTYTEFRDAREGRILPDRTDTTTKENIIHVVSPFVTPGEREILENLDIDGQEKFIGHYIGAIQSGDYGSFKKAFEECLSGICLNSDMAPALWSGLTSLFLDSPYKSADFEAPLPKKIVIEQNQAVQVNDDQSGTVTVVLSEVQGTSASTLAAYMDLTPSVAPADDSKTISVAEAEAAKKKAAAKKKPAPAPASAPPAPAPGSTPSAGAKEKPAVAPAESAVLIPVAAPGASASAEGPAATKPNPAPAAPAASPSARPAKAPAKPAAKPPEPPAPVHLAAQSVTLDPNAHTLTLTFPSPGKLGVTALLKTSPNKLVVKQIGCDPTMLCPDFTTVSLPITLNEVSASSSATGFQVVDAGSAMTYDATTATGSVQLTVNNVASNVIVNLNTSGADLVSITPSGGSALSMGKDGYQIAGAGVYNLTFKNLTPGALVTVTASGAKPASAAGAGDAAAPKIKTGSVPHTFVALPQTMPAKGT